MLPFGVPLAGTSGQGQRILNRWDTKDLRQVVDVPACHAAAHRHAVLVCLLLQ